MEPLTVDEVVRLALANSPDVLRGKQDLAVASAKAYADGLPPDPTLSFSMDRPGAAGYIPGFMVGLSYEISTLVALPAKKHAAEAAVEKQQLALEWTEWQVANHAYALYVAEVGFQRVEDEVGLLSAHQKDVAERMQAALERGHVTRDVAVLAESAYRESVQQLDTLQQEHLKSGQELTRLLGLRPKTQLTLVSLPDEPEGVPQEAVSRGLAELGQRRPDLLALRAAYVEQDERYREALLGQFPRLDIGITRGRDTSRIYTSGLTVSVTLPLFNGNRGNIALEKSTRGSLYEEYTQRLRDAYGAVNGISSQLSLLGDQLRSARSIETMLQTSVTAAHAEHDAGDVTLPVFADLESRLLLQHIATVKLANAVFQQQVELCTLIGVSAIDHQPLQ
ncbi:TolC family protein [Caballeronia mineralivorans]|uniref:TolC family protein n=1 Tax=Caballeronia mineralivorans TaxID=2010198 RepID=UPI0023F48942|nr:TolC family protein [Caballeronia mineralivorans]MDB5784598.1 outer rane efflux family protein [Caballeronia mineralivorans]